MEPKRPFTALEWGLSPEAVRHYILYLEQMLKDLQRQVQEYGERIDDPPTRPTLISQGVGVSLSLAQRDMAILEISINAQIRN